MPKIDYRDSEGGKLSGTTTIIGGNLGWSKNQLMWWAWKQGTEGKDFRDTSGKAAEAGTIAHDMIDSYLKNEPSSRPDCTDEGLLKKAEQCFQNFLEWATTYSFTPKFSEVSLVSSLGYGSTLDCLADVSGKFCLVDWKTSDAVYADYVIQLASYGMNWNEHNPDNPITSYHLLRIDKGGEKFTHHRWGREVIEGQPWEAFKHLLALHEMKKAVEGLAK